MMKRIWLDHVQPVIYRSHDYDITLVLLNWKRLLYKFLRSLYGLKQIEKLLN